MFAEAALVLEGWTDFYVIAGTSAGALPGLAHAALVLAGIVLWFDGASAHRRIGAGDTVRGPT